MISQIARCILMALITDQRNFGPEVVAIRDPPLFIIYRSANHIGGCRI